MALEIDFRNCLKAGLQKPSEEPIMRAAEQTLEEDNDLAIYPSKGGIYYGRDEDDYLITGISPKYPKERAAYVVAHEIGHDHYWHEIKDCDKTVTRENLPLSDNGVLLHQNISKDSIRTIESEIVAELAAENVVSGQGYALNPLVHSREQYRKMDEESGNAIEILNNLSVALEEPQEAIPHLSKLISTDSNHKMLLSAEEASYSSNDFPFASYHRFSEELVESVLVAGEAIDTVDLRKDTAARIYSHYWNQARNKSESQRNDMIAWKPIADRVRRGLRSKGGASTGNLSKPQVEEILDDQIGELVVDIVYNAIDEIEGALQDQEIHEKSPHIPSPSHMMSEIARGKTRSYDSPDISHQFGNWLGRRMAKHGVELKDVNNPEILRELSYNGSHSLMEVSKHPYSDLEDLQIVIDYHLGQYDLI